MGAVPGRRPMNSPPLSVGSVRIVPGERTRGPELAPLEGHTIGRMAVQRMDHVGIVVDDLEAATAFFVELGLERQGGGSVEGDWVGRVIGLEGGVRSDLAFLATPDGHSRLELAKFHTPPSPSVDADAPSNTPGLRHLTFAVDDIEDVVARLRARGGELVGEIVDYQDIYRLCYLRGPDGIIVELAERIG
jgi:catechol 2,3-dioxygenase-like lactoylglutathione lyase family enzyme